MQTVRALLYSLIFYPGTLLFVAAGLAVGVFSRNAMLAVVDGWERGGIALHVIDLGGNSIDSKSAAGRFMLTVLAGAAEMERNLTRERTRSALAVKRANGERVSGRIPFGFDLAADGVNLIANQAEQGVLAEIRTLRRCGVSFAKIAKHLNDRGVPAKRGIRWFGQTIRQILNRPVEAQ